MIGSLSAFLVRAQNPDGGWPTCEGRQSSTEATSFACLALARLDGEAERAAVRRGVHRLVSVQNVDGSWPLSSRVLNSSWTTAVATLALASLDEAGTAAIRGMRALLRVQPRAPGIVTTVARAVAPDVWPVKLDPSLKGWPWTAGAASFVEPTAYALLALKKVRDRLPGAERETRIADAERMIYDRMCREGGWNYGNSTVLGAELWPYADVTALALLALADHRDRPENTQSLAALRRMISDVHSGLALAWTMLCFAAYGEATTTLRARLQRAWQRTGFLGEVKSAGLALLAVTDGMRAVTA